MVFHRNFSPFPAAPLTFSTMLAGKKYQPKKCRQRFFHQNTSWPIHDGRLVVEFHHWGMFIYSSKMLPVLPLSLFQPSKSRGDILALIRFDGEGLPLIIYDGVQTDSAKRP